MDIATHFQSSARVQSFLEREKAAMLDEQTPEVDTTARRKSQRPGAIVTDGTGQFRKPSLPASATRQNLAGVQRQASISNINGSQRPPSLTNTHKRKTSGVVRNDVRVPSGPREYPGSPGKRVISTNYAQSTATAPSDQPKPRRQPSLLPTSSSEPFFGTSLTYNAQDELTRGSFGNPSDDMSEPTTPASQRTRGNSGSMDFLPTVNFDEFQTSLGTLDTGSSFRTDLLDEFPAIGGGRVLRSDTARAKTLASSQQEPGDGDSTRTSLGRDDSFRQRFANRASQMSVDTKTSSVPGRSNISAKSRRQSNIAGNPLPESDTALRAAQKSVRAAQASEQSRNDLSRSTSLLKARRTTMTNAIPVQVPEKPRSNITNGIRQGKGKSLLTSTNNSDPNTPNAHVSRNAGGQTPNSSGNRRQSIVSGRASGLGARTISPTDARRIKRMSVAPQQPPLPFSAKGPPTPGEEVPTPNSSVQQQHLQGASKFFELPRLIAAPSPSLIPTRKDSSSLASNSARASPSDGGSAVSKFGYPFPSVTSTPGPALSAKSSYASLHTTSSGNTASQSRVPVSKSRNVHSSGSAQPSNNDESQGFSEIIPPVPAIPKAYDSPKDYEPSLYGRQGSITQLQTGFDDSLDNDQSMLNLPASAAGRSSFDSDRLRTRKSLVGPRSNVSGSTQRFATATVQDSPEHAQPRLDTVQDGRQNNNLQPLRLPPLNLMSMTSSSNNSARSGQTQFPHPSQEIDERNRDVWTGVQTPDWSRHGHKTPSTPMTASKATFFKRHGESDMKSAAVRSSTSHFGVRDNFDLGALRTGWMDDSDDASGNGVPIPGNRQNLSRATGVSRNAITPFASGSLPKGSGEFARLHGRPSGELADDAYFLGNSAGSYDGLRLAKAKTFAARPSVNDTFGRSLSHDQAAATTEVEVFSPASDSTDKDTGKKEGGLRRKLSLSWRRSGSKAASRADNHKTTDSSSSMLPPRLPASAAFTGDGSLGIGTSTRPSLDLGDVPSLTDRLRRQAEATSKVISSEDAWQQEAASSTSSKTSQSALPKTRSLHSERPQPVSSSRSSSWANFNRQSGIPPKSQSTQPRNAKHGHSASTMSALVKDKDDLAADEEMRKLTQKKKEVDNVAKQTEELMRRASPKEAIDLEQILHDRHNSLNIFERGEVVEYEDDGVYFTGAKHAKKIVGALHPSSQPIDAKESDKSGKATNYGYDDERGDYNIVFGDHLAYRYEVCDVLGKGSFGQVVRCIDHKEGGVVAIKIIRNKKRFHQQALVEVGILGKLREWDPDGAHATLSITGSFYFRSHLCIVTPCLSINLYELIRAHNFTGFTMPLIRRFARQMLATLSLLQQKRVIHCDLKPENILLCSARAADIRVIDFGSSCREEEKVYTYIQSRFYRSPEVILGSSYGLGIDMWSVGCILAELWTGYPIFPGENEQDQLACIMEVFGPPDRHLVERCTRKKLFFDSVGKPRVTVNSKGRRRRPSSKTLQQALKTEDEAFVDFIARCLRWDPDRRLKPNDACGHPFITNQPLRPGIPDEARRAVRVRSTAAAPTGNATSPVKRISTTQQPVAATPQKTTLRQAQETPQTALRAPMTSSVMQVSPAKAATNRRQSTVATAGSAAAYSTRRQSSGAALAASMNMAMSKTVSLAEKAARESMAATTASNSAAGGAGRWRV